MRVADPLSKVQRSALMSKVRARGNKSTEKRVAATLAAHAINGWRKHPAHVAGKPDLYFPDHRLAVFLDGCFWHACPACKRRIPRSRSAFWRKKIQGNRLRDEKTRRKLRRNGYHVVRIWEHELKGDAWLRRLEFIIKRIKDSTKEASS